MATCSTCGFETDFDRLPLPRCPRCGATVGRGSAVPAAPPSFGGDFSGTDSDVSHTLYGVPDDSMVGRRDPGAAGPPAIGLDLDGSPGGGLPGPGGDQPLDPDAFDPTAIGGGDLRLGELGSGEAPSPFSARAPERPPPSPPGLGELPTARASTLEVPAAFEPSFAPDLDLPAPVGSGHGAFGRPAAAPRPVASGGTAPPATPGLDLPMPAGPARPRVPAPIPSGGRFDLDSGSFPGPPPALSRAGVPPPPPSRALERPMSRAVPSPPRTLEVPRVPGATPLVPHPAGLGNDPISDFDLPAPTAFDLPTPSHRDQLRPVGSVDLPTPIALDLEPAGILPTPATQDLEPADTNLLEPAENQLQPADVGLLEPKAAADHKRSWRGKPVEEPQVDHRRSPAPRALPAARARRGLLWGGLVVVVVGAIASAVVWSGILDPAEATAPRGVVKVDDKPAVAPAKREVSLAEHFALDTPAAYAEAMAAADTGNDPVGKAEAALLLELRYGPDPVLVGQAATLLDPFAASTDPEIVRVLGLLALAKGDLERAETALADDSPRTRLYRAMLRLAQGDPGKAAGEAEGVAASLPDELGAVVTAHAGRVAEDARAALPALEKSLERMPDHPGLAEVMARAGIASGELARARRALEQLEPTDASSRGYRARVAKLRGDVAIAVGEFGPAIEDYDASLALVPKTEAVQLAKVRALLAGKSLTEAVLTARDAIADHPESVDARLLGIEVYIESGKGDEAMTELATLATTLPDDPRVPYWQGQVHAMRMQLDEAGAAFAAALAKSPTFYRAPMADAELLAAARQPTPALAKLELARKLAGEAGEPAAVTEILVTKAKLLEQQQQTAAAVAALDEALAVDPSNNPAQVARGVLRLELGKTDEGQRDLAAVFERTGGYPGLVAPLGRILIRTGKLDEVAALVGDGADHPAAPVEVRLIAARLKLAQGDPEAAKVLLDGALVRESGNWEAHMLMARAFLDGGDYLEALERIELAKPKSQQAELHLLKGKIFEYNGKHKEAGPEYQQAVTLDAELHEARFLYGRSLVALGANQQGIDQIQYAIDRTGDRFPEAYLELGKGHKGLGDTVAALAAFEKATDLNPELYEAYYLAGRVRYEANEAAKAADSLEKATVEAATDAPWFLDALEFLGKAQAKQGANAAAKATYTRFLTVAPPQHASRPQVEKALAKLR